MISFVVVLVLLICFIIYCNISPKGCDLCNSENCKNDCLGTPEKPEVTKEPIPDPVVEKVAKKVAKKAAKKTTKKKNKE